jgi:phosphoglucomutase
MLDDRSFHGDAARTVATSHFIDSIAKKRAMRIIEVPVGFKYISPLLREKKIIIGGEESGGISFVTHIPEKDGIASALMLIESISMSGTSLSETMAKAQDEYGSFRSLRQDIKVDHLSPTILDDMKNRIGLQVLGESVSSINKLDGMKITLSDASWLLFRLSGTENMLRIYAESDSISKTEKMLAYGRSLIR